MKKVLSKCHANVKFCQAISITRKAVTSLFFNTVSDTCHTVIKVCNTVFNVCYTVTKFCNTSSSPGLRHLSRSLLQSPSFVTQSSSPVTQSSSSLTRSSVPISVSVTQTSALGSWPLVSSVPAVRQSLVSLPPVTQHSAYLKEGYTSSTPMTQHGTYLTTSLQQGWVTSSVMYQQPYQDFTPQSLYGKPPLYVPLQSQPPSPDNTQQLTEALANVTQLHRLPQARPDVFRGEEEARQHYFYGSPNSMPS